MSGCRLGDMPANEMLDVLHVLFEEDAIPKWPGELDAKSQARSVIYKTWYKREYLYAVSQTGSGENYDPYMPDYSEPLDGAPKPFIPPTPIDDLQSIIGAPMGE